MSSPAREQNLDQPRGRQALVQAGLKLFAERGFAGTSVRDLAAAAGVSPGLIRSHFQSKEGLREAIDAHAMSAIREMYEGILQYESPFSPETVAAVPVDWVAKNRDVLMYIRMALFEASPGGQAVFDAVFGLMLQFVDRCDERGILQDGVDREVAALYLFYDFIGPAMLAPFAKKAFGKQMYHPSMVARRNQFMGRLFTTGMFK